jgi:hypothetical protein
MFNKDKQTWRDRVPRTTQEAFGPYHSFDERLYTRTKRDLIAAAVGIVLLGILYGWLMYAGI